MVRTEANRVIMSSHSSHRTRAERNFHAAALRLQSSLPKETCTQLGEIPFPDFNGINGVETKARELEGALERLIQARTELGKKEGRRRKVGGLMISWFRASYPFANIFLSIGKQGAAVSFSGPFTSAS